MLKLAGCDRRGRIVPDRLRQGGSNTVVEAIVVGVVGTVEVARDDVESVAESELLAVEVVSPDHEVRSKARDATATNEARCLIKAPSR